MYHTHFDAPCPAIDGLGVAFIVLTLTVKYHSTRLFSDASGIYLCQGYDGRRNAPGTYDLDRCRMTSLFHNNGRVSVCNPTSG